MLRGYKELKVWKKAYALSLEVYKFTKGFPSAEKFGLTSQIRRAVISIPSNIAEGYGRKTTVEYIYALYIAYGSLCELETQIMILYDLNYIDKNRYSILSEELYEVGKMLNGLIKSLQNKLTIIKTNYGYHLPD
jgi:four helix bundle protein